VGEDGHSSEGVLESVERMSTILREIPRSILLGDRVRGTMMFE